VDYIGQAPYPVSQPERIDAGADAWMAQLKDVVGITRSLRGEMALSPSDRVPLLVGGDLSFLSEAAAVLKVLAKLSAVELIADEAEFARQ
ncbi:hypothetical protein, partial [Enterobacter ludwigii]